MSDGGEFPSLIQGNIIVRFFLSWFFFYSQWTISCIPLVNLECMVSLVVLVVSGKLAPVAEHSLLLCHQCMDWIGIATMCYFHRLWVKISTVTKRTTTHFLSSCTSRSAKSEHSANITSSVTQFLQSDEWNSLPTWLRRGRRCGGVIGTENTLSEA